MPQLTVVALAVLALGLGSTRACIWTWGVAAMRDLTCHVCKRPCDMLTMVLLDGTLAYYTKCKGSECAAAGPRRPTPEQAAAAHLSVTPAPACVDGLPQEAGGYWFNPEGEPAYVVELVLLYNGMDRSTLPKGRYFGPLPLPVFHADSGKGGGA